MKIYPFYRVKVNISLERTHKYLSVYPRDLTGWLTCVLSLYAIYRL